MGWCAASHSLCVLGADGYLSVCDCMCVFGCVCVRICAWRPHPSSLSHPPTQVSPQVHPDADTVDERLAVEDTLQLVCEESWVTAPDLLLLPFGGRGFEVEVGDRGWVRGGG